MTNNYYSGEQAEYGKAQREQSIEHKWEFNIRAGPFYDSLATKWTHQDISLGSSNDPETGICQWGYSVHLDDLEEEPIAVTRLSSLELLFNGALRAASESHLKTRVEFTELCRIDGNIVRSDSTDIDTSPFTGTPRKGCSPNCLAERILSSSKTDDEIREMLFLLGLLSTTTFLERVSSWGTLYKIYDAAKSGSSRSFDQWKLNNGNTFSRFKATCNSPTALGLLSRHGKGHQNKNAPPKGGYMTDIDEAFLLMRSLANKVIIERMRGALSLT